MTKFAILAALTLGLSACATYNAPAAGSIANTGLAGTSWELVSFTSMDDTQGVTRPRQGATYRVDFQDDGRLALVLDCNRGNATWSEGIANATGGSVNISDIASTKAICPQPDMGELLARQLPYAASYRIEDNQLFIALAMDGGIFEFKPN